jgi:hypothetical protein
MKINHLVHMWKGGHTDGHTHTHSMANSYTAFFHEGKQAKNNSLEQHTIGTGDSFHGDEATGE